MSELIEELQRASTVEEVRVSLKKLSDVLSGSGGSFRESTEVVTCVIVRVVAGGLYSCLPENERTTLVDSALARARDPAYVAAALCRAMSSSSCDGEEKEIARAVVSVSLAAFASGSSGSFERSLRVSSPEGWDGAVVHFVASVPQRLINVLGNARVPEALLPDRLARTAVSQCLRSPGDWTAETSRRIGVLIGRLVRLGLASMIAEELSELRPAPPSSPSDIGALQSAATPIRTAVACVPESAVEGLLRAVLDMGGGIAFFSEVAAGVLSGDGKEAAKVALTKKMIGVRPPQEKKRLAVLVSSLSGLGLLRDACSATFSSWGDPAFARHCPYEQHSLVTEAVALLLPEAGRENLSRWGLLASLLSGIQERMSSSLGRIRDLGMKAAVAISVVLDPSKPLKFDDEEEKGADEEEKRESPEPTAAPPARKKKQQQRMPKELDPDEAFILGEQPEQEQEQGDDTLEPGGDEDDDLVPYAMDDDADDAEKTEDGKDKRKPAYLRQCLAVLTDTHDAAPEVLLEAAEEIREIVRRRPDDVGEMAEQLLGSLLFLHEIEQAKGGPKARHAALLAVTVAAPERCAKFLATEFYRENHQLSDRSEILCVVRDAAVELSAIDRTSEGNGIAPAGSGLVPINKLTAAATASTSADASMTASRTRRWHSTRAPALKPTRNRFLAVSGAFFFPLMRDFDKQVQSLHLLGHDSFLLAGLVTTLVVVLTCSREVSDVTKRCESLLSFVSSVKAHPDAAVRRSVLHAVLTVVASILSSEQLFSVVDALDEWRSWVTETAKEDPDEKCREIAKCIASSVVEKIAPFGGVTSVWG